MIATILGILLLVGAIGAGVILVGQKQLFQQKAVNCIPNGQCHYGLSNCCNGDHGDLTCSSGFRCGPGAGPIPNCRPDGDCRQPPLNCCNGEYSDHTCSSDYRCGPAPAPPPGATPTPKPATPPTEPPPPPPQTAGCILGVPNDSSVPNAPTLRKPKNGATIYGNSVTLTWSAGSSNCPGVDVYDVVDIWFPNGTKAMEAAASGSYFWSGNPPPAPFGTYRWNVTTYNVYGQTASSADRSFTLAPGETAQCLTVKAYDTNWNLLTQAQLSSLSAGNKVRFTVAGTPADKIDKAKFTINGVERAETAIKNPGTDEFYDEYTIPTGTTSFTVNAKLHHVTLGWF